VSCVLFQPHNGNYELEILGHRAIPPFHSTQKERYPRRMTGTPIPPIALLRIFGVVAKERGLERRRHNRSSIGATRISSLKTPLPSQSHSLPPDPVFPSRLRIGREEVLESSFRSVKQASSPFTDCLACQVGRSLSPYPPAHHTHPASLPSLECRADGRRFSVRPSASVRLRRSVVITAGGNSRATAK